MENLVFNPVSNGQVELFFHFNKGCISVFHKNQKYNLDNYFVGLNEVMNSIKIIVNNTGDKESGMSVRFTFSGVYRLINSKIAELSADIVTCENIWGLKGKQLAENMFEINDNTGRIQLLNNFFTHLLSSKKFYGFINLDEAQSFFNEKNQKITVENLASVLNMSYRTLHRRFINEVGICPKEYMKIIRIDSICKFIDQNKKISLSEILFLGGYFDQSHFIHEFKEVMKITPNELLQQSKGNFYITRGFRLE